MHPSQFDAGPRRVPSCRRGTAAHRKSAARASWQSRDDLSTGTRRGRTSARSTSWGGVQPSNGLESPQVGEHAGSAAALNRLTLAVFQLGPVKRTQKPTTAVDQMSTAGSEGRLLCRSGELTESARSGAMDSCWVRWSSVCAPGMRRPVTASSSAVVALPTQTRRTRNRTRTPSADTRKTQVRTAMLGSSSRLGRLRHNRSVVSHLPSTGSDGMKSRRRDVGGFLATPGSRGAVWWQHLRSI